MTWNEELGDVGDFSGKGHPIRNKGCFSGNSRK